MGKINKNNDKKIIDEQINYIANNYYKDELISICNGIRNHSNCYGKSYYIKDNDYEDTYMTILNDQKYFIVLKDQSIINICYRFDDKGKVLEHNLSFIPPIGHKQYIRFDYHDINFARNETDSHLHISTLKDCCRIPVDSVLMPNDFLFFILKYFYNDSNDFVKHLKTGLGRKTASQEESIYIRFLNDHLS